MMSMWSEKGLVSMRFQKIAFKIFFIFVGYYSFRFLLGRQNSMSTQEVSRAHMNKKSSFISSSSPLKEKENKKRSRREVRGAIEELVCGSQL